MVANDVFSDYISVTAIYRGMAPAAGSCRVTIEAIGRRAASKHLLSCFLDDGHSACALPCNGSRGYPACLILSLIAG